MPQKLGPPRMTVPLHISFADIALARESERAPSPLALRWYAVGSADNVKKCFMKNLWGQVALHRLGNGNDSEVPSSKLRHYQRPPDVSQYRFTLKMSILFLRAGV